MANGDKNGETRVNHNKNKGATQIFCRVVCAAPLFAAAINWAMVMEQDGLPARNTSKE